MIDKDKMMEEFLAWKNTGNNWAFIDIIDNAVVIWQAAKESSSKELEAARRTAEYWKAEHNAANVELEAVKQRIAELVASVDQRNVDYAGLMYEKEALEKKLATQQAELKKVIGYCTSTSEEETYPDILLAVKAILESICIELRSPESDIDQAQRIS